MTLNNPVQNQGNILVNDDGDAVICDFGFSRTRHEVTRTRTAIQVGGTGRYLAPELSAGPEKFRTERSSDVYSMGMTFYALATQSAPFSEHREHGAIAAAQRGERPSSTSSGTTLPEDSAEELWALMRDMWDHDPRRRPNASEVSERMCRITDLVLHLLDEHHTFVKATGLWGSDENVIGSDEHEHGRSVKFKVA